jgi:hypothetical protein
MEKLGVFLESIDKNHQNIPKLLNSDEKQNLETLLKEAESFLPKKRRRLTPSEFNDYLKPLESGER